ncbi:MAG: hypothetical protein K2G36_08995 [Ruminococcus sp.]|nr:hypothetical protein [Ruminococcus sp.]
MAGRPRKNNGSPAKRGRKPKAVVEEVIVEASVAEETVTENPVAEVAEEPVADSANEVAVVEEVAEEIPEAESNVEEEVKPKRKYTKRVKPDEEVPVVAEEEPKPKRKYTRHVKAEEVPAPTLQAYIQGAGAEISLKEMSEMAVKLSGVTSPKSVNLYIKPYEDDGIAKVYYVVDNKAGHFNLFN